MLSQQRKAKVQPIKVQPIKENQQKTSQEQEDRQELELTPKEISFIMQFGNYYPGFSPEWELFR